MSERFIKYIPSEKSNWLMAKYPFAFLLLTLISQSARRVPGHIDGLLIGDAIIGDHKAIGATRQKYRTALAKLVELDIIEIVYNGKKFLKREKSTIKVTIKGTLVNLKDSSIWDINSEVTNQHINQQPTNSQPTANHKQERTKKEQECKELPQTPSKNSVVVVFYDCLKEIDLPDSDKKKLTKFSEHRVALAVKFVSHPDFVPKKGLIQTLIWHCKSEVAPIHPEKTILPEVKLAIEHNELYKVYYPTIYSENLLLIHEGYMKVWELGTFQQASLKHPYEILRKDFDKYKKEYASYVKNIENTKHVRIQEMM